WHGCRAGVGRVEAAAAICLRDAWQRDLSRAPQSGRQPPDQPSRPAVPAIPQWQARGVEGRLRPQLDVAVNARTPPRRHSGMRAQHAGPESITTPRLRLAAFAANKRRARLVFLVCANGPRAKRAREYGFRARDFVAPRNDEWRGESFQNQRSPTWTVSPGLSEVPSGTTEGPARPASAWVTVTMLRLARGVKPPAIATALSTVMLGT